MDIIVQLVKMLVNLVRQLLQANHITRETQKTLLLISTTLLFTGALMIAMTAVMGTTLAVILRLILYP